MCPTTETTIHSYGQYMFCEPEHEYAYKHTPKEYFYL